MVVDYSKPIVMSAGDTPLSFDPRDIRLFHHSLAARSEFTEDFLASLLDDYPREDLNITTMGQDGMPGLWREGRVGNVSGKEILQAVEQGHLWLNVKYLHRHSKPFAQLIDELYQNLAERVGQRPPHRTAGTLLISSPQAFVEYHADSIPNILWHIRGRKEVLIYPSEDSNFSLPEDIERICSGEQDENLPFSHSYDAAASKIELNPGLAVMWPQNAPHRVNNLCGLNISLSTEHVTPMAQRRVNVHRANRLLRRARWQPRSIETDGPVATLKSALANTHRAVRRLQKRPRVSFQWPCTFRVDASSTTGFVDESQSQSLTQSKGEV